MQFFVEESERKTNLKIFSFANILNEVTRNEGNFYVIPIFLNLTKCVRKANEI